MTGTFIDSTGRSGSFLGTYQLLRILREYGMPAAAGVFAGRLDDADGRLIGVGSRRHTAVVAVSEHDARLGPLDVNLLGFTVRAAEIVLPGQPARDVRSLLALES